MPRMPRMTRKTRKTRRQTRRHRQKGGLVEEYTRLFDSAFGDQWILTGSEAVRLLADHFGIGHSLRPGDLDVVVVSPDLFYGRTIGSFQRVQTTPERSMQFINPTGHSFDIITTPKERYVEVPYEGHMIRVIDPIRLLREYESELDVRGNKRNADTHKIAILKKLPMLPTHELNTRQRTRTNRNVGSPRGIPLSFNLGTPPRTPRTPPRISRQLFGGYIPDPATVVINQDPNDYSVPVMVSAMEAKNIFSARE